MCIKSILTYSIVGMFIGWLFSAPVAGLIVGFVVGLIACVVAKGCVESSTSFDDFDGFDSYDSSSD